MNHNAQMRCWPPGYLASLLVLAMCYTVRQRADGYSATYGHAKKGRSRCESGAVQTRVERVEPPDGHIVSRREGLARVLGSNRHVFAAHLRRAPGSTLLPRL